MMNMDRCQNCRESRKLLCSILAALLLFGVAACVEADQVRVDMEDEAYLMGVVSRWHQLCDGSNPDALAREYLRIVGGRHGDQIRESAETVLNTGYAMTDHAPNDCGKVRAVYEQYVNTYRGME